MSVDMIWEALKIVAQRIYDRLFPRTPVYEERMLVHQFSVRNDPVKPWTLADDRREEALYLQNPLAFWLRPDRHEYGKPCWALEAPYELRPNQPRKEAIPMPYDTMDFVPCKDDPALMEVWGAYSAGGRHGRTLLYYTTSLGTGGAAATRWTFD